MFEIITTVPAILVLLLLSIIASFRMNTKGMSFIIYNLPVIIGVSSTISAMLTMGILIVFNFADNLSVTLYLLSAMVIWGIINGGIIVFIHGFIYTKSGIKVTEYKEKDKLIEQYEYMVASSNKLVDIISTNYPELGTTNEVLKKSIGRMNDLLEFAKNKQINSEKLNTWAEVSILRTISIYNYLLDDFYDKLMDPSFKNTNKIGKLAYNIIIVSEESVRLMEFIKMSDTKKH